MRGWRIGQAATSPLWLARTSAVIVVTLGGVCLAGYGLRVRHLASAALDMPMAPNTAVALILAGASLWLAAPEPPVPGARATGRRVGRLLGAAVAVIGIVVLAEYLVGPEAVVDRVLFPDLTDAWRADAVPGRPSPPAGLGLLVVGLALALLDAEARPAGLLAPAAAFVGVTALIGGVYGLTDASGRTGVPGMAPQTALTFLVLSAGVLACRPRRPGVRAFTSPGIGGTTVRRLTPAALGVVVLLGVLLGVADRINLTLDGLVVTVAMTSVIALMYLALWYIGTALDRAGVEQRRLADALRDKHDFSETVLNSLTEGVVALGPDGGILRITPRWTEITGYQPVDVLGRRPPFPWWPSELVEQRSAGLAEMLVATTPSEYETQLVRADGVRVDVFATMAPILNADGGLRLMVITVRDVTDRIVADRQRRHLAEQLDHLFAMSRDLMCIAGTDGFLKRLNPAWEHTLGHSLAELLAHPYIDYVHPDERAASEELAAAMAERRTATLASETRLRCADGTYRWIDWNATLAPDEGLIYGIGRDVTEQRQGHEAGELLAAIVDSTNEAIIGKTLDGTITSWNRAAERIYGYRADEVLGQSMTMLFPPERLTELDANLASIRRGQAVKDHHSVRRRKDGTLVHVGLSVSPMRNADGRVVGGASIVRDITGRRRAEEEFERLVLKAPVAMVMVGPDGTIKLVNEHTERLFGYARAELVGQRVEFLVPYQLRDAHAMHRQGYLAAPVIRSMGAGQDLYGQRRDGTQFPVEIGLAPLDADEGQLVSAVIHDITDRKQIQHALAAARDEALAAAQLRSQFVAMVSHEIRTPMNGVIGLTNLLLQSQLDPAQKRYADAIQVSARALLIIINDILDFSKIEAGKVSLVVSDFDLGGLVEDVVGAAAEASRGKDIEILGYYGAEVPVAVRGDEGRLRQVLLNLTGNAVKFTERGEVIVRVDLADHAPEGVRRFTFSVIDTGIGIAPADISRLFDAFIQADSTTSRRFGGTGLGLTISRQLVELMGGELEVDSRPGHGSRFVFTIPLEPQGQVTAHRAPARHRLSGCRILIVDDNATSRGLLAEHARAWGMTTVTASKADTAMAELAAAAERGEAYDVAVLDQHMPGTDGLLLAGRVLADPGLRALSIVVLSSGTHQSVPLSSLSGIHVLAKPVGPSALYNCLLKLREPGAVAAADEPARTPTVESPGDHGLVLLAEDNDINQLVALDTLAMLGYHADRAGDGLEAVRLATANTYQAILMDCQMPKMDGFEATRELRRRERPDQHVPIIALTAGALAEDRQRCLDAGMDDYVVKPIDPEELRAALERATN
jgi:PAS domain S-box-containing protein